MSRALPVLCVLVFMAVPRVSRAQCSAVEVRVDNDVAGSGYSEERAQNWVSYSPYACAGTYRYLTRHQGDGTRRGKATWKPSIRHPGWYQVTISWRASENRTDDADYHLYGNDGARVLHQEVDQRESGDACMFRTLAQTVWCEPGGGCRLVLDGDDGKSDCADVTLFKRVSCDAAGGGSSSSSSSSGGGAGPCDAITQAGGAEVCEATASTCAGVFTDGQGCHAFCARAGMVCTERRGGEPGCMREEDNVIPCDADIGHQSDWCACSLPAGSASSSSSSASGGAASSSAAGSSSEMVLSSSDMMPVNSSSEELPSSSAGAPVSGGAEPSEEPAASGAGPASSMHAADAPAAAGCSGASPVTLPVCLLGMVLLLRRRRVA